MWGAARALVTQNYWVITLVFGAGFVGLSCISPDKQTYWIAHSPSPIALFVVGVLLLVLSAVSFIYPRRTNTGLDFGSVKEKSGVFSAVAGDCEIRVIRGRLEKYPLGPTTAVVLPCNEYFDDECAADTRSALGAYVNQVFKQDCADLVSLIKHESIVKFGYGQDQQKTENERAKSFGPGRCLLISHPLGHNLSIALVSTTTQRAGEGLQSRISFLFDGIQALFRSLADARLNEVVMPVLGAGHGRLHPPLAFIGLLIAITEAARYGHGGQRPRKVTVVVFQKEPETPAEVDDTVIRRGLALISSGGAESTKAVVGPAETGRAAIIE